ncbi:uncharacterized protein LOC108439606 [Pygocentrus nattereri]|uniref:uncharacterized protein LOC108439606 n=1 Tax=Pygocentrus nattereri TaxID=42514 RepID=UPI001891B6C8|nr:uncharacterized protein LOC108439606 [Pygocentrus nattereri]
MIPQMCPCVLLGVAVMLLNAGGNDAAHQDPSIFVSLKEMTLVDQITLNCVTSPHHNLPCSFYSHLTEPTHTINISQSHQCVLNVSGQKLFGTLQVDRIRTNIHVYCIVTNGTKDSDSKKEIITVWRIGLPMSYVVFGLGVFGSLIIVSLAFLCVTCVISISTKGRRKAYRIRRGEVLEGNRDTHKLNGYDADSAPQEDEDEKEAKVAEDELCYATVIHPENCARSITFEQRTEYATVVIYTPDPNKQQSRENLDTVDDTDDAGRDEGFM